MGVTALPRTPVALEQNELDLLMSLSDGEIFNIFECENFAEIEGALSARNKSKLPELIRISQKQSAHLKRVNNKITESLVDFTNLLSWCLLIIDTIFTLLVGISVTMFAIAGAGFSALFIAIGIIHFATTYDELKKQEDKSDRACQLLAFKSACADAYIRKNRPIQSLDLEGADSTALEKVEVDKNRWQRVRNALGAMVVVSATLFYTYYAVTLSLTVAFASAAFVGAMCGPIGIGVALGVAFAIGAYFAFKKYQLDKNNKQLKNDIKALEKEFSGKNGKLNECEVLRSQKLQQQVRVIRAVDDSAIPSLNQRRNNNSHLYPRGVTPSVPLFIPLHRKPANDEDAHGSTNSNHHSQQSALGPKSKTD